MKQLLLLLTFLYEVKTLLPCENFQTTYGNRCADVPCTQNIQCQSFECNPLAVCKECINTDAPGALGKCEGNQCEGNLECQQSLCYKGYCDV